MRQSTLLLLIIFFILYVFSSQIRINLRKNEISQSSNPNLVNDPYFESYTNYWSFASGGLLTNPYQNLLNPLDLQLGVNYFVFFDDYPDLWISQQITTEVNIAYELSFLYISFNSYPRLVVIIGNNQYVINDPSLSSNVLYEYKITFTATSASTLIKLKQLSQSESNGTCFTKVFVKKTVTSLNTDIC